MSPRTTAWLAGCAALTLCAFAQQPGAPAAARQAAVTWAIDNVQSIGGHRVTAVGAPRVVETAAGRAVEFNGSTDGLILEVNPIQGLAQFTVEVLFEPAAEGPEEQRFLHLSEAGSDNRLMMETRMLPDRAWSLDTYLRDGAIGLTLLDRALHHQTSTWHAAALTYDGKTMCHYVDGVRELAGDVGFRPMGAGRTSIGVRQNLVSWFKGRIRLIRISPAALPASALLTVRGMPAGRGGR